jgi:hypothetical protein
MKIESLIKMKTGSALFVLFMVNVFFLISCSGDSQTKNDKKDSTGKTTSSKPEATETDYAVIATDICDCISDYENALSDQGKEMIMKGIREGILDSMTRTLSEKDRDVYSNEGTKASDCVRALAKKHPIIKSAEKMSKQGFSKAMEDNCSEFGAALMVILN